MHERMPAISVVMTTYNSAFSVRDAVLSIVRQTFADIEIIIVDDASTDETPEDPARNGFVRSAHPSSHHA